MLNLFSIQGIHDLSPGKPFPPGNQKETARWQGIMIRDHQTIEQQKGEGAVPHVANVDKL